jgi:hypothetical protein
MKTPDLIDALARTATPVRRLRPPMLRACGWLLLAGAILGLLATVHGVRPDLLLCLQRGTFITAIIATLATAMLAAFASFKLSLPETSRWWCLLPLPTLLIWVSTIGYGCLTDWVAMSPNGIQAGEAAQCFATLLFTSVPLSIALMFMLRHAAALRPSIVSILGGLSVAAMTAFVLALIHEFDATIMILIWNLGAAVLIAGFTSLLGRRFFAGLVSRLALLP